MDNIMVLEKLKNLKNLYKSSRRLKANLIPKLKLDKTRYISKKSKC